MAQARQQAVGRGMGGTSVVPSMRASILRQRGEGMRRLDDQLVGREVQTDIGLTKDMLGVMERREDGYPDPGAFMSAMGAAGAGAAGGRSRALRFRGWGIGGNMPTGTPRLGINASARRSMGTSRFNRRGAGQGLQYGRDGLA